MNQRENNHQTAVRINLSGYDPVPELILSEERISIRVKELGSELGALFNKLGSVHVVTVLQGAMHFSSDLQRAMQQAEPLLTMTAETIRVQSYQGTESTGTIRSLSEFHTPLTGKHVLLVEDIYDTGKTLRWLCDTLQELRPASLTIVTLLDKLETGRPADLLGDTPIYVGFTIPNDFVIGYGLDFNQLHRNLRGIYRLNKQG